MKDIGSLFPLYSEDIASKDIQPTIEQKNDRRINYSLCREAMYAVAKKYEKSNKIVLIPAYTCQTVIDPFVQQGWKCFYYNIRKELRIDIVDLFRLYKDLEPAMIVVHPFHGMELKQEEIDALTIIKSKGCILMEDITQCIYTINRPNVFDYVTGSYRKWFKVPDGGFLESHYLDGVEIPKEENSEFVNKQTDSMYLRGKYFNTGDEQLKNISIRLNKDAVAGAGKTISLHKMSDFSLIIMNKERNDTSMMRRLENYQYLFLNINSGKVKSVCSNIDDVTTLPLYFPIYVKDRACLQRRLAKDNVYAPILWPINTDDVLINDNIKEIYSTILMIPIDQRYDVGDMSRIVKIINDY
jgi:hypothetical protein